MIQDGIEDAPPIRGWASALGGFGQHRFEVSPLGVREAAVIYGVFHALTEKLRLKMKPPQPKANVNASLHNSPSHQQADNSNLNPQSKLFDYSDSH